MSLRTATLLAALGIAAGTVTQLFMNLQIARLAWVWLEVATQLLMAVLLLMLYREMKGRGQARHRQDLAIPATILSGILLHWTISEGPGRVPGFRPHLFEAHWVMSNVLLPLAWIAFLLLLVIEVEPLKSRAMLSVASILAVLSILSVCWNGYFLFFRVGMAWLSLSWQRSLGGLLWNIAILPFVEVFRDLSMVVFLILLCKKTFKPETI